MTTPRQEYLSAKFNEFLDRFSPPRAIQNNPQAMQDDANAMLETVLRHAPRDGYSEWLDAVLRGLQEGMTTRSWPAPGELAKACKGGRGGEIKISDDVRDSAACDRLEAWFRQFGTQMPGHGNPAHTAEMIRRGVFTNERDARFRGFDLSPEMGKRVDGQAETADERRHHDRVMEKLAGWRASLEATQGLRAAGGRLVME